MTSDARPLPAEACHSMPEVRAGVDAVDAEIVALLARRYGYMRAAARIKQSRDAVRDEPRKAEVIANAVAHAEKLGVPADTVAALWELLVEDSIAREMNWFDERAR